MRRIVAVALLAMMSSYTPLLAAGQAGASVSGTVRSDGRAVRNTTVRLRNIMTNQITAMTRSNAAGQFSFTGLMAGTYAAEVINAAGEVIGTSSAISVAAGAAVSGVTVTAVAGATASAAGAGLSRAAIAGIISAGGASAAIIAVKATGSPSR